jgi:tripartite-type tricarboxylate transporter receptor subunit TctC
MHRLMCLACLLLGSVALAQPYPVKPIRLIVGFAPGGSTDVVARMIAVKLTDKLGQQVVVDNRAGAGSNIATQVVARASADGYTLLFVTSTQPVNVTLYGNLPYNLAEDFIGVAPATEIPSILVVHPSIPAKTVRELIALAKVRPGEMSYASAGVGAATHLAGELFKSMAGIDLLHVPYKGAGPALSDLIGGHVHMQFIFNAGQVLANEKAGKLRSLAVTSAKRLSNVPRLPTMQEAGLKNYEATVWNGIIAPRGTPGAIATRINTHTAQALKELAEPLLDMGAYPMFFTPEQYSVFIKQEITKWADVVKRSGARAP